MTQATATAEPSPRGPRFPASKFRVPKLVPGEVCPPRLLDRLDRAGQVRLALVVGPAGTGKTMLLADWLAARPEWPAAWLSCDAADADPARFVAAIIEAARYGFDQPSIGEDTRQLMSLDGEVSADAVAALADDLDTPDKERVLVIDDIHLAGRASADALRGWWSTVPRRCSSSWPAGLTRRCGSPGRGHTRTWSSCATGTWPFPRRRPGVSCPDRPAARRARAGPGVPAQRGLGGRTADGRDLDPGFP